MPFKINTSLVLALTFLAGAALPAFVVWNPWHWGWADHLISMLRTPDASPAVSAGELWTCGMHPEVVQGEPGNCPICGMKLVPVKTAGAPAVATAAAPGERKIKYWRAPMDPNYVSDKPGKSPMGMDLIPVYEDDRPVESGIRVDPGFLQNFAVRTAVVERGSIPNEIHTVGILAYNEKNIASVNTKFEGWIEKAYVNYLGEAVERGQVLFEVYSPPLVTTQQEYLSTLSYVDKLASGSSPDALQRARALLSAARERLHYWDITDSQIEELRQAGRIHRTLKIVSPVSGIVTFKMSDSLEGVKLSPGMNVYKIADLSTVWAHIDIFEYQIQFVRLGQRARIALDAFPGREWSGRITYLDPAVNQKTRTLRAYVEIPNPDRRLRPEMYAQVTIRPPAASGVLRIPAEAILHTGERNVVIVQKGVGVFEPREVVLGSTGGGYTEILRGLGDGETVVTSSQFLIDSESNLKEAISKILAPRNVEKDPGTDPAPPKHIH